MGPHGRGEGRGEPTWCATGSSTAVGFRHRATRLTSVSLVLNSGAMMALSRRDRHMAGCIAALRRRGLWPPIVPTAVLVESLTGNGVRDVLTSRVV
jgi:hypothetical protein